MNVDLEIATKIFHLPEYNRDFAGNRGEFVGSNENPLVRQAPPPYSTNMNWAMLAVYELGDCLHLRQHGYHGDWEADFCGFPGVGGHAETPEMAICLAILATRDWTLEGCKFVGETRKGE